MSQLAVSIIKCEAWHIEHVAKHARQTDIVEVYESSRRDMLSALRSSTQRSEATATITVGDEPVGLCGVGRVSMLSNFGVPWMIGTDTMTREARLLLPYARDIVVKMMVGYDRLTNMVHVDNKASIRWLKYMGFIMGDPQKLGWRGAEFMVFNMMKEDLHV